MNVGKKNMGSTFINPKILVDVGAYIKCMNYYLTMTFNFKVSQML